MDVCRYGALGVKGRVSQYAMKRKTIAFGTGRPRGGVHIAHLDDVRSTTVTATEQLFAVGVISQIPTKTGLAVTHKLQE